MGCTQAAWMAFCPASLRWGEPEWIPYFPWCPNMSAASLYAGVGLGWGGADRPQSQWGLLPKVGEGLWTQVQQAQPADS